MTAESPAWPPSGEGTQPLGRAGSAIPPWLPFGVGTAAMLAVGGYRLTAVSLDWDEGATISAASRSVGQIVGLAHHVDGVIAPYYLFLHFWIRIFGSSDLALRAPSLVAMALGAGLAGELGRRLIGPAAGVVAGLICAVLPPLSYYAAQARPYALVFLLATLATVQLFRAAAHPSWLGWIGYACCLLAAGLAHIMAASVLVAHLIIVAVRWRQTHDRRLLRMLPPTVLALTVLAPLAVLGSRQQQTQLGWVTSPTWRDLVAVPQNVILSPSVAFLLAGLALVAAVVVRRRTVAELAALTLAPVAVMLLVSFVEPVWVPRYGTFVLAPLAVLAAAAITAPARFPVALRATVVLGLLALQALPVQIAARRSHSSPDSRGLAGVIEANAAPGDGLVFGDFAWSLRPTVQHYLTRAPWSPPVSAPRDLLLTSSAAQVGSLDAHECRDIAGCLGTTARIWLVTPSQPEDPVDSGTAKMTALRGRYTVTHSWPKGAGMVSLLVRRR